MSEFSHHIAWMNPIAERLENSGIEHMSAQDIAEMRSTCERVLRDHPESGMAQKLLEQLATTSSRIHALAPEAMEHPDHRSMREIVAEAVGRGILREEVFPAKTASGRPPAYLLSSSHPAPDHHRSEGSEEDTIQSQVELFQFVHLMHRKGMKTPIHVEGRMVGRGYTEFPVLRPKLERSGRTLDIHDPEAQAYLFEHPGALSILMHQYLEIAAAHRVSAPIFYAFTSYPHIEGAHSRRTEEAIQNFSSVWMPFYRTFMEKYAAFFKSNAPDQKGMTHLKLGTGWDGAGTPMMQFANQWVPSEAVIREFGGYLTYADMLTEIDTMREQELAEIFAGKPGEIVPIGFSGKAHEYLIADRVTRERALHSLTPASSVQHDHLRRRQPINDPACGLLWIDVAQKVIAAARAQTPRKTL